MNSTDCDRGVEISDMLLTRQDVNPNLFKQLLHLMKALRYIRVDAVRKVSNIVFQVTEACV